MTIDNTLAWLRLESQNGNNPVLSVEDLKPVTRGNCPLCQKTDVNLVWQIQFLDGSREDASANQVGTVSNLLDSTKEFI